MTPKIGKAIYREKFLGEEQEKEEIQMRGVMKGKGDRKGR